MIRQLQLDYDLEQFVVRLITNCLSWVVVAFSFQESVTEGK